MAGPLPAARAPVAAGTALYSNHEREAAFRLGALFRELSRIGATPLGTWAIAPEKGRGENNGKFYAALGVVYGSDPERQRRYGVAEYRSRVSLYKRDYDAVVPSLLKSIFKLAAEALQNEADALQKLINRLLNEPELAERLHRECKEVLGQAKDPQGVQKDVQQQEAIRTGASAQDKQANEGSQTGQAISYLSPQEFDGIIRKRAGNVIPYTGNEVLRILFQHPNGLRIVEAYAKSARQGTETAFGYVLNSRTALQSFAAKVTQQGHALRYPFFVISGVIQLGLKDVPGFPEFAVSLGQLMSRDKLQAALGFAAMAVGCLALVFAGPAAPGLTLVLAMGDLALAGADVAITFFREREQDLGHQGSALRKESSQFATQMIYADTALGGAAALLSAIAFFSAVKDLRAVAGASTKALARNPAPARVALTDARASGAEAKAISQVPGPARAANETAANRIAPRPAPDERYVAATSKDEISRAIESDAAKNRLKQDEQVLAGGEQSKAGKGKPAEPEPVQPRATDRPAEAAEKQPAAQRQTNRPADPAALVEPPPKEVPLRRVSAEEQQELRKRLLEQIKDKELEIRAQSAEKEKLVARMNEAAVERNRARLRGDPLETAKAQARYDELRDEVGGYAVAELVKDKELLQDLLGRTTADYFDRLAAAAARRDEYTRVARRGLDGAFKPMTGPTSVEHVYPKSRIFDTPGFLALNVEQQEFLFNLEKNLKVAPARFNTSRGVTPYKSLSPELRGAYLQGEPELKALIDLEAQVERDVADLIANPHSPSRWGGFGYKGSYK